MENSAETGACHVIDTCLSLGVHFSSRLDARRESALQSEDTDVHLFRTHEPRPEAWWPTFLDRCEACLERVEEAFETFLLTGQGDAFESSVRLSQQAEEAVRATRAGADGRARTPGAAGPGGDLAGVADGLAGTLSAARSLLYALRCQRVSLPAELAEDFAQLVDVNLEACRLLLQRLRAHLSHPNLRLVGDPRLGALAQESDRLARAAVFRLFGEAPGGDADGRLLLRDVVLMTGALSARARRAADTLDTLSWPSRR